MPEPLLAALSALADAAPDAPALDDGRRQLSRAALRKEVDGLASVLTACGARTVALAADNGLAGALVALATRHAGLTLLPLAPFFSDEQTAHALATAAPDVLLTDAPDACPRGFRRERESDVAGLSWLASRSAGRSHPGCALLSYTSGSTGRPKGIRLPAATLDAVASSLHAATHADDTERHLATLPLAVLLEQVAGLERVLRAGGTVLLPPLAEVGTRGSSDLHAAALLAALHRHRASSAIFVPGALQLLVEHLEQSGARAPESCRFLGVGGAPVPLPLLQRAARLGLPVYEGYGLTEAGSVVAVNAPGAARAGSVGRPLAHLQVEIVPVPEGAPAPAGTTPRHGAAVPATGEIVLRGPLLVGALDGEPDEADATCGGPRRFATGDLGHLDADGFLHVTGRRKNLFVTSFGRNVSPEWVERHLLQAEGLRQAVVLGEGRSRPAAVLVAAPGADLSALERRLQSLCAGLPEHARPERLLFVPPLTVADGLWTATGRPRRDAIAAAFGARLSAPALSPPVPSPGSLP